MADKVYVASGYSFHITLGVTSGIVSIKYRAANVHTAYDSSGTMLAAILGVNINQCRHSAAYLKVYDAVKDATTVENP